MSLVPYALTRPFLFGLDAERAHELTLDAIARLQRTPLQCLWWQPRIDDPVQLAGLTFPNRIGLAAGLDKNGRCIDGFGAMGFGFVEVGTVTPKAQPGNPRPRLFRLPRGARVDQPPGLQQRRAGGLRRPRKPFAIVSRAAAACWGSTSARTPSTPIERAADDYLLGLEGVFPHADYVTINVSSPNTKDLRSLQGDAALDALLSALVAAARRARARAAPPGAAVR